MDRVGGRDGTLFATISQTVKVRKKKKKKPRLGFRLLTKCASEKPGLAFSCWKGEVSFNHCNHAPMIRGKQKM